MLPTNLSEEEQWAQINYPTFDDAMYAKIAQIRTAMLGVDAQANQVNTQLNYVPVSYIEQGEDIIILVGLRTNEEPFYRNTIPLQWIMG